MSTDDPVERELTGIHLKDYQKKCRAHPWYRETQILLWERGKKVQACLDAGIDPGTLFDEPYKLTVDEEIGFALAAKAQPDIWPYFVAHVEKLIKDPEAGWDPYFLDIVGPFKCWYRLHRGKAPPRGAELLPGIAVIHKFLRGELPSLDGPEASAYALSQPETRK